MAGTCELTTLNGTSISSTLSQQVMLALITPERVADSLRVIFPKEFIIDYSTQLALEENIVNWANDILNMLGLPDTIKGNIEIIKAKAKQIAQRVASLNQSQPLPTTNESMLVLDEEHFKVLELVEYSMLNNLYGTAQLARTEMQNMLRTNVIASLFVNFKEGYIVKNIEEVNLNITNFLQQLYLTILEYAKLRGINTNLQKLFSGGVYMNPTGLRTLAEMLFKDFTASKLNSLFSNRMLPNEGLALRAYNSWVILNNFDTLVKNLLGKTIVINELYKGTFLDASKLKYRLSKESNLIKTWRVSENVSAIDELGNVSKLLIESAPIFHYDRDYQFELQPDEQIPGQTLELKDVMFAFGLAQLHKDLKNTYMQIRYNPMVYVPMFIKAALNVTYDSNDQLIKNILYSVYKRFFLTDIKDTDDLYSLVQIMNLEADRTNYIMLDNLLSYITGIIDKTVPNSHLEYAIDSDTGFIATRFSSMNSLNSLKIMVQKTINNINDVLNAEDRDALLSRYRISRIDDNSVMLTRYKVEFSYSNDDYTFEFENRKGDLRVLNFKVNGNKYGSLTGNQTTTKENAKDALLGLIDSTLRMSLQQRPEILEQFYDLMPNNSTYDSEINALLLLSLLSGRVLLKHSLDKDNIHDRHVLDNYYGTDSTQYSKPWFNLKSNKILSVINERQSSEIITKLALALMIINGDIAKSTVRNLEGNQVAADGLTNLINTIKTTWNDARLDPNAANAECIFALHPDLLHGITIKSAAQSSDRLNVKADKDFNVGESGFAAVMLDFLTGYGKRLVGGQYVNGRGLMQFLPTVYSDKTTNSLLVIDGNTYIERFGKNFIDLTPEEVGLLHFETMSNMYAKMKQNILADYTLFFNTVILNNDSLNDALQAKELELGIPRAMTWEYFKNVAFPVINDFAKNGVITGTIFDKGNGERKTAVEVFDQILKPQTKVIVNVHYSGKKDLEINPVLDYHFTMYNGDDASLYNEQVAKYQAKFAKHCILNFRIDWKNSKLLVDPKLLGAIARLGINLDTFEKEWVDSKTGQLIIAKTLGGRPLTRVDVENEFPTRVNLNPIIRAFYDFDLLISTLFVTSTVGGCYGHKNNFKKTNAAPGTIEYWEEQEAGRTLTQFKRMVIYPATMHNYQQELLTGCATKIQVANISDIPAHVFNFLDAQDDVDAHDGSGFCLPWESDWENGSLGESAAGEDKKTIGHHMDGRYLMESEFKWALFALTNERIRNAGRTSGINLKNIVRRMSDRTWNTFGRLFDFTRNHFGERIGLLGFGKDIYFKADDLYTKPIKDDFGAIDFLFDIHPELAEIGTKELFYQYLHTIYPESTIRDIFWHGSDSDFSRGLEGATRVAGSGAPETGTEMYFNRQPWASLLYITGVNRNIADEDGFNNWVKLWWELKEILGNGRMDTDDWRKEIIGPNVRQLIPNKAGVFNRTQGGKNGSFLAERKARYGYQNRTDEEFFRGVFGIDFGKETFNDWVSKNRILFLEMWKNREVTQGIYPVLLNSTNPITESGLNTYYEEQRGLFTQAKANANDAILSNNARNELNSDVAVIFDPQSNVTFLGSEQNIAGFRNFIAQSSQTVIPGRHYKVKDIIGTDTPNRYNVTLAEVDTNGQQIGDDFVVQKEIDSNYKLWEAFGAEFSEELYTDALGNSSLINSNSSSQLVAFFGNNSGYLRTLETDGTYKDPESHPDHQYIYEEPDADDDTVIFKTREELEKNKGLISQRDVYLPMKYSDISYLVNTSAVKNGQSNVNPTSSWYDNSDFTTFWIDTKHFGVLMDADHHADDSELTEMSLVISALESNGYTHHIAKEAYRDLGAIVYAQIKPYMQAIEAHYQGDGRALYEVVGKAFLDAFLNSSSNRGDLADQLVYNLKTKLGENKSLVDAEVWIPFSDTTVLSKLISTITSLINKSAIKRKYAGTGAVMIPAYDLIKIYKHLKEDGSVVDSTFGGMVNSIGTTLLAALELERMTNEGPELNKWQLELGKSYINLNTGERFTIDNLDLYYSLRDSFAPEGIVYKEDFTQGRNLQPARTTFRLADSRDRIYDIYDTDAVRNKLRFSKWYQTYKNDNEREKWYKKNKPEIEIINPDGTKTTGGPDKFTYLLATILDLQNIADIANDPNIDRLINKMYGTGDVTKLDFYVKQIGQYLQQKIVQEFENLHDLGFVTIDGRIHFVVEGSIVLQEAELVLSKLYATKFGLKPGTYLDEIDENFFRNLISGLLATNDANYNIALKRSNGQHVYIVFKDDLRRIQEAGATKIDPPLDIDEKGIFRRDTETGEQIMPFNDCELYVSDSGIEYIVTDNVQLFLDSEDFDAIQVNADINPEIAIEKLRNSGDSELLNDYKKLYTDVQLLLTSIANKEASVIERAAKRKWTSFQKSLEFTAARIPSQSMQSFMPMKVVGFTDSEENKAYVSHFLTFLQGSDYDIDKVYLLGNEFDKSGMYIGWSPLFDLSDYRLQLASELLPMPTGKEVVIYEGDARNHNALFETVIVTRRELQGLEETYNSGTVDDPGELSLLEGKIIDKKEELLLSISNFLNAFNESESDAIYFNSDKNTTPFIPSEAEIRWFENTINRHQRYLSKVSDDRLIKMTKNSVSSKIRRIINHPLNMVAAYSPIEMNAPREAANKSTMGTEEREYGLMNPAVKWILHELNMVGKKAIGITAVGEKVLFALLFYYNEIARTGDISKQRRAFFNKRFNLIKGEGMEKIEIIRNIIANVNLLNYNKWSEEIEKIGLRLLNKELDQEQADFMSELLIMQMTVMEDSALINSALLSAATDNAKELILSKINANPDMLKIYTYCIVLGIDFNYIADLMTSSTVNAISKLSKDSIFDPRYYTKRIDTVLKTIHNGIDIEKYGVKRPFNEPDSTDFQFLYDLFAGNDDVEPFWYSVFRNAFDGKESFESAANKGLALLDSYNVVIDRLNAGTPNYYKLNKYIQEVRELLTYMKQMNTNDLNSFEELLDNGEELNLFGRVLGINQGIRTNMADKIGYLDNIEDIFNKRMKSWLRTLRADSILAMKPYLSDFDVTEEYINGVISEAENLEMVIKNQDGTHTSNFNALKFLQDDHYKEVAIELYDFIKNTINVFDVIDTVPHFKAMTKAAAVDFVLFDENSAKFALAYNISREVKASQRGLNKTLKTLVDRDIVNFLSQIVTNNYFRDNNVFLSLATSYYDERGEFHPNNDKKPIIIDMSTPHGQATFKYWFENTVIPRLKRGMTSDNNDSILDGVRDNKFIRDLLLTTTERTLTRNQLYVWTLPINMSNTKSVTDVNNFVGYLGEFTNLENYDYNGHNIVKLFSWYNLLVYKNQYGQDSLTRIFENYMAKPGNVMQDYFDYVGRVDYNRLLSANDFDIEDIKINCAPEVSIWQTQTSAYLGDYIKIRDRETGAYVIYKYNAKKAAELKRKSGFDDDDLQSAFLDAIGESAYEDDMGATTDIKPLVYDPIPSLMRNLAEIINYFSIITPSTMVYRVAKAATSILRDMFEQRKAFIYNNCG